MNYRLLAYRDLKLEAFASPFIMSIEFNDEIITELARRNIVSGGQETIIKYRDLDLYEIGTFNDDLGVVVPLAQPHLICKCGELKGVVKEDA